MTGAATAPGGKAAPSPKPGGCRAVVTGAGRGIGRAVALSLVEAGYQVTGVARTPSDLAAVAKATGTWRGSFLARAADVRDSGAVAGLFAEAAPDRLDLLVCCAGVGSLGGVAETTPEAFAEMTLTNLVGPFLCLHHARAALAAACGTAVFLVSRAARATYPNAIGYGSGKAGLVYLIGAAARDLAPVGVRVIGLSPGAVATPMRAALFPAENPAALIQPEEVAGALMALLDPRLSGISGTIVDHPW